MQVEDYLDIFNLVGNHYEQLEEGKYLIYLRDSNEFSKLYTILDNDTSLELEDATLFPNEKVSNLIYSNDRVRYHLKADLPNDRYLLEIEENIYAWLCY